MSGYNNPSQRQGSNAPALAPRPSQQQQRQFQQQFAQSTTSNNNDDNRYPTSSDINLVNMNNYNNNNNIGSKTSFEDLKTAFNTNQSYGAEDSLRLQLQHDTQQQQYQFNSQLSNQNQNRTPRIPPPASVVSPAHESDSESGEAKKQLPSYYYPAQPTSGSDNDGGGGHSNPLSTQIKGLFNFPCSSYGKGMILVIGIEALLVIIMQIILVGIYLKYLIETPMQPDEANGGRVYSPYLDPRNQSRSIVAYLIVFVFAQLFQLVFAWDAVRAQNTIEVIGMVLFNLCCFAYSIFEISQTYVALKDSMMNGYRFLTEPYDDLFRSLLPFLIVVVCVLGIGQFLIFWLAYQLFQEFGWKIYKKIGADPNIKKMYREYQVFLVLIKIDFFFFVGFSIQFIYLTLTNRSDPEYWITIFVLPITIIILWVAIYAVRHESRRWMSVFLFTMFCGIVYFVFKVCRMWIPSQKIQNYEGVKKFLTLFASLCLITILLTIVNTIICFRNFGKGLKPHLVNDGRDSANDAFSGGRQLEID
ncbi:hypothetical protein BGZ80_001549 [Entomortierella chlamydospora]|uniref:Uncharacterized protein n=1 Tax=Entomortierella chlamydospora TaxID=101097 RepID=A0A9P6SXU4_9FUNG|nr:hypothetical protein BGZ79_007789 [Entomortierella chlamydospora]KAG0010360.1 hypothetical protein BGZ80_001549 [Entomortierella chlamydospora]